MREQGYWPFIYSWIWERNQAWLQKGRDSFLSFSTSEESYFKERNKMHNIWRTQEERNMTPLKRESTLLHASEDTMNGYVHICLRLRTRSMYSIKGHVLEEALEEDLFFVLAYDHQGWRIHHLCDGQLHSRVAHKMNLIKSVQPDLPLSTTQSKTGYDRKAAVAYAEKWWNSHNPKFTYFAENDCTNFISQCLYAGGIRMNVTKIRASGWWYKGGHENWSFSWGIANKLKQYLSKNQSTLGPRAKEVSEAKQLELGDVICYDWQGDGRWDHNTIVTDKDANGEPLVNAHTDDSQKRFWEYTDSKYYDKKKTKYTFFHIVN